MESLFEDKQDMSSVPLAERARPKLLSEVIGQEHLIGEGKVLSKFIANKSIPSLIFWGPPGVGKTTLANVLAKELNYKFESLSAVDSGVKDLRQVIISAENRSKNASRTILFIDEIHRFNKSQQDALLHAVEKGIVILIGATTENPSFEVNSALLSRCRTYKLNPLSIENIKILIDNVLLKDEILNKYQIYFEDINLIPELSGGDARTALNILESAVSYLGKDNSKISIDRALVENIINQKLLIYDKKGEYHYDVISAFIKSLRGSDPDAALFWMARMIESGEDAKFIARRMVIFASEDIGNAEPAALQIAISVFRAVEIIGLPECIINLAQGVTYLAAAPKSNASYLAVRAAQQDIKSGADTSVPLKLRNAPTKLMKQEGYSVGYQYPHDFENHFVKENYFPDNFSKKQYYKPTDIGREKKIKERLYELWKK